MTAHDVKIAFYENSIPSFVETELERLYANVYSTLHHLNVDGGIAECTSTYVAEQNGTPIAVLLVRIENGKASVLGAICCCVGKNYFAHVLAHDPLYDSYRLGTLCAYLAICECIRRDGKEFHFLGGRYDYKYLLLGVDRALYRMTIYRSYLHLLLNGGTAFRIALAGHLRRLRSKLLENAIRAGDGGVPARLSLALLKTLRACRQLGSRSLMQRD